MPSMSPAPASHGFQSCPEPRQAHPMKKSPQIQRWVTAPFSAPDSDHQRKSDKVNGGDKGGGNGGWSSFYSLSQPSQSPLEAIDNSSYKIRIPPPTTYNTKFPKFAKKNLEMITETLGCETGVAYTINDFPINGFGCGELEKEREAMLVPKMNKKRVPSEFPPPLTTLSGGDPIRLKSRREDGRLLLLPFKPNIFEAERKDGRLRLRLLPNRAFSGRDEAGEAEERDVGLKTEDEEKEAVERSDEEVEEEEEREEVDAVVEGSDEDEDEDEEEGIGEEMKFCNCNGGDEAVGSRRYRRTGRCKEEGVVGPRRSNAILNSDAFWVASS